MSIKKFLSFLIAILMTGSIALAQQKPSSTQPSSSTSKPQKEETKQTPAGEQSSSSSAHSMATVTGEWEVSIETGPNNSIPVTFKFTQSGESISGTASSPAVPNDLQIIEGKLAGDQITFAVMVPREDGSTFRAAFSGKITGDTIEGKVEIPQNTHNFKGTRKKPTTESTPSTTEKTEKGEKQPTDE